MTSDQQELPVVAIVGRPNVGKSSLFNILAGKRISIVHEESGVTRDRVAVPVEIDGVHLLLVDTGGLHGSSSQDQDVPYGESVRRQVEAAVSEAGCVVWVVDAGCGFTAVDNDIADMLRRRETGKVLIAANKADNRQLAEAVESEYLTNEFEAPIPISCSHHSGLSELNERILDKLRSFGNLPQSPPESGMRLAVLGRPNVGKSSLVNALLGEDRVLVSSTAGTTRDAVDIPIEVVTDEKRVPFTLIDTGGLRQRRRVDTAVELFSVMRAENAVKRCDAAILVLDGSEGVTAQDRRVARLVRSFNKPCLLAANKWDLAGREMKMRQLQSRVEHELPFMNYAPFIALCALSGYNLQRLLDTLFTLIDYSKSKIPTPLLNQFLHDLAARHPAPPQGKRRLKFFYGVMVDNPPPRVVLFVNDHKLCRANYRDFISNQLQAAFFPKSGLPVCLELRSRRREETFLSN